MSGGNAATSARPRDAAGASRRAARGLARYGLPFLALTLGWQLASDAYGVPELFPPPARTAATFCALLADGTLLTDLAASLARILTGLLIGSAAGTFIGLLMGCSKAVHAALSPYVNVLRFISAIAWISVFMIWLGIGEASKIAVIVYATAFTLVLSTIAGVAAIPPDMMRAARALGASAGQRFRWVTLPASAPSVITGIRLSLGNAFLVIVAAEMVQADSGLGFLVISGRLYLAMDVVFAAMITIGVLGLLSDRALVLASRHLLRRYHPRGL